MRIQKNISFFVFIQTIVIQNLNNVLNKGLYEQAKRAISVLLIICLLTLSVPAAPPMIAGSIQGMRQHLFIAFKTSNFIQSLIQQFTGANLPLAIRQETQGERNLNVTRIEIQIKNQTPIEGEKINLWAVPYDQNDIPVSGVTFEWEVIAPSGEYLPVFSEQFKAKSAGNYTVIARGAGQESRVDVTVISLSALTNEMPKEERSQSLIPLFDEWNRDNISFARNPRNERGNSPGKPKENSNFNITAPVLSIPGRGMDLSLSLNYNSRVWSKLGPDVSYDMDRDWIAPGWSLGFGKVINMVDKGIVQVEADGTRRYFGGSVATNVDSIDFRGQSTDGTYIKAQTVTTGTSLNCMHSPVTYLKYPNGITIQYGRWSKYNSSSGTCFTAGTPITMYPQKIIDRNGNGIDITVQTEAEAVQSGIPGKWITQIRDTLGRYYTFNYTVINGRNYLTSISGPGLTDPNNNSIVTRTFVRLSYKDHQLSYNFSGLTPHARENNIKVLAAIYYPATNTGFWFGAADSYSPYGMIRKVEEQKAMSYNSSTGAISSSGQAADVSRRRIYSYPENTATPLSDIPEYSTVTETWDGMPNPAQPAVTTYSVDWNVASAPRTTTVTAPFQSGKVVEYSFNLSHLADTDPEKAKDGITYKTEYFDKDNALRAKDEVTWELGYDVGTTLEPRKIPRPTQVSHSEYENGITLTKKSVYEYNPSGLYNQVETTKEYGYGGDTDLLRRTTSQYINKGDNPTTDDDWSTVPRIINLPTVVEVFDKDNARIDYTKNEYDLNPLVPLTGTTPPNFCVAPLCNSITQRGNLTKITKYAKVTNSDLLEPVTDNRKYDRAGNLIYYSRGSSEAQQIIIKYTDITGHAYPSELAQGNQGNTQTAPPIPELLVKGSSTYDYQTGLQLSITDPNL